MELARRPVVWWAARIGTFVFTVQVAFAVAVTVTEHILLPAIDTLRIQPPPDATMSWEELSDLVDVIDRDLSKINPKTQSQSEVTEKVVHIRRRIKLVHRD